MFLFEWQRDFKAAYLEVAHALQARYAGEETTENNKKAVLALRRLCDEYLTEEIEEGTIIGGGCNGKRQRKPSVALYDGAN